MNSRGSSSTCRTAQALAATLGDPHRLGWVATYLLAHFVAVCEPDHAIACGQRALAIAADLGDVGITVTAQIWLGSLYRSLGDYRRSVDFYQKTVGYLHGALLHEHFGLPGPASVLPRTASSSPLSPNAAPLPRGGRRAEEGVQLAEAADHPYSRVVVYWGMGFRALRQGDLPQAICHARTGPPPRTGGAPPTHRPLGRRVPGGGLYPRRAH